MCGSKGIWEISLLSYQFCCELKTAQKKKKFKVFKKGGEGLDDSYLGAPLRGIRR